MGGGVKKKKRLDLYNSQYQDEFQMDQNLNVKNRRKKGHVLLSWSEEDLCTLIQHSEAIKEMTDKFDWAA